MAERVEEVEVQPCSLEWSHAFHCIRERPVDDSRNEIVSAKLACDDTIHSGAVESASKVHQR